MDPGTAARGVAERGVSSVQFVLAAAMALFMFLALANLVVVQYGKGALRAALEQGARAGTVGGVEACHSIAEDVIGDLLGGRMSDGLVISCRVTGGAITASGAATFEAWTPLTPDFSLSLSASAVIEP